MEATRCPACGRPYALVGRVHRCVPRTAPVAEQVVRPATAQVVDSQAEIIPSESNNDKPRRDQSNGAAPALRVGALPAEAASEPATPAPAVITGIDLASGPDLHVEATIERAPDGSTKIITLTERKPAKKRKSRAAYMRAYRQRVKAKATRKAKAPAAEARA